MSDWKRPENIPFPKIWRKFEGKTIINGKKRQYWVQDLTEEFLKDAVNHMVNNFMKEEAICKYNKFLEEPESTEISKIMWTTLAKEKLSLICLTKNNLGEIELAGVNMLYRLYKNKPDNKIEINNKKMETLAKMVNYMYNKVNIYDKFNVEHQLTAKGLFVLPKYRREGVGMELLKSRAPLCRAVGIPVTLTLFTSLKSQKMAEKVGFKLLYDFVYDDLEKYNPDFVPEGIREAAPSMKYMYMQF